MTPALLLCIAPVVTDADTMTCKGGQRIRLAGITALERNGRCNSTPDCPTMPPRQATAIARKLVAGQSYRCRPYGRSGKRIVAACVDYRARDLGCQIVRSGAAVVWRKYAVRYGWRCR